jgi:hypothetical protein
MLGTVNEKERPRRPVGDASCSVGEFGERSGPGTYGSFGMVRERTRGPAGLGVEKPEELSAISDFVGDPRDGRKPGRAEDADALTSHVDGVDQGKTKIQVP